MRRERPTARVESWVMVALLCGCAGKEATPEPNTPSPPCQGCRMVESGCLRATDDSRVSALCDASCCSGLSPLGITSQPDAPEPSDGQALCEIARDVEALAPEYPQLRDFSAEEHSDSSRLITYGYHTHRALRAGGWSAAVPNPDDDGVWFTIDFHDPASTAQIHTQPVVAPLLFRDKQVLLLILEGASTRPLAPRLHEILLRHGVHSPP